MTRGVQYNRQPCPGRIFEDLGNGFAIGCFGGSLFYFCKGAINAPSRQRFLGGLRHVRNRAPFLGGNFGLWGGIFSICECTMIHYRQRDDPFNAIVGGFVTGGVLSIRGGASVAFKQAMMGGVILCMIEAVGGIFGAYSARQQMQMQQEAQRMQVARMKMMMSRGGENPWEAGYSEELVKSNQDLEAEENAIKDQASVADDGVMGRMTSAKSF